MAMAQEARESSDAGMVERHRNFIDGAFVASQSDRGRTPEGARTPRGFTGRGATRARAAWRVVSKAIINRDLKRLYAEARSFMKLRAERNKIVQKSKDVKAHEAAQPANVEA